MSAGQIVQLPLAAGVDESTDPKLMPAGKLLSLRNGVWRKEGRTDKRFGTKGLSKALQGGGVLPDGVRLVPTSKGLALVGSDQIYAYSSAGQNWRAVRQLPQYTPTWSTVVDSAFGVRSWDAMRVGDYEVMAWTSGDPFETTLVSAVYVEIRDGRDGSIVMPPTPVGVQAISVRLVDDGVGFGCYLVVSDGANIKGATITPSSPSVTAFTTLRADAGSSAFDACRVGGYLVLAYGSNSLTPPIRIYAYFPGGAWPQIFTSTFATETATSVTAVTIAGDLSDRVYVSYVGFSAGGGTQLRAGTLTTNTFAVAFAPVTVESLTFGERMSSALTWLPSGGSLLTYYSTDRGRATSVVYAGGVVDTSTRRAVRDGRWTSRPFRFDGRLFALASTYVVNSTTAIDPSTTALVELETTPKITTADYQPLRHIANIDLLIGGYAPLNCPMPSAFVTSDGSSAVLLAPFQSTPTASPSNARQGLRRVSLMARGGDYARPVSLGDASYVCCGLVDAWDGALGSDVGFAHAPAIRSTTVGTGGGMAAGDYLYSVVAEYRDANGVLQRSPPATPVKVTVGAGGKVTLSIQSECLDHHEPDLSKVGTTATRAVVLAVYRSTQGGTVLYRLTQDPGPTAVLNDPIGDVATLVDDSVDGTLATRPTLYTTGGILEDRQPPAFSTIAVHKGRIWGICGRTLWFTKAFADDPTIAPGFHELQRFEFDDDLVSVGSMDEKLVIFSASRIWIVTGDGPAANGQGSDYPQPIAVQTDVGCVNPRSLVSMPNGLMFESPRGIYQLSRGLELSWVGKPVRDRLEAFPRITSAVLVPEANQVRFTANNVGRTAGIVLVLDYVTGQWATHDYFDAEMGGAFTPIADACLYNGVWTFVTPLGKVYQEDPNTFLDDGAHWVTHGWELAWIESGGPLGYQRVRKAFLLGDRYTECDVTLSFGFDHHPSYVQRWTWTSDALAGVDGVNIGMRVGTQNGANPRCRAFRVKFEDAAPSGPDAIVGNGQGVNVSAVGLEIVPKPGMDRRPARARA